MAYKAHILLGRITKVHGFEGYVNIKLEKYFFNNIPEMESVFVEIEGKLVPFFISGSEYPGGDILRLKFEGYESSGRVNDFTDSRIFLTSGKKRIGRDDNSGDLYGFTVRLKGESFKAKVTEIIENPGQRLLNIKTAAGKEILVPLHEDFIINVDKKNKIIVMKLPEGLIDLN